MKNSKLEIVGGFLKAGIALIVVDARQPGVVVPEHLRCADLVLKISHRFDPPDLELTDYGIACTLSFDRRRSYVVIPWAALYAAQRFDGVRVSWAPPAEPPPMTRRRGGLGLVS